MICAGIGGLVFISKQIREGKKFEGFRDQPVEVGQRQQTTDKKSFLQRIARLLPILIPRLFGKEVAYIIILGTLLSVRTALSSIIADVSGIAARYMVMRRVDLAVRNLAQWVVWTIPAAFVNSGLKYFTLKLALAFRINLNTYVHERYLNDVTFYNVCNLGQVKIDNVAERITVNIQQFSEEISDIYAATFKPLMDILLFTYKLAHATNNRGPIILFSYFAFSSLLKIVSTPDFGKLGARESQLAGDFRSAHERLITNSEEVAFYDGSRTEKKIINGRLQQLENQITVYALSRSFNGVVDNIFQKYWASIAGYFAIFAPLISLSDTKDKAVLAEEYARNQRYLTNLADAISSFVLLGNKISLLKGHTRRVGEIIDRLDSADAKEIVQFTRRPPEAVEYTSDKGEIDQIVADWNKKCSLRPKSGYSSDKRMVGDVEMSEGENICFQHIDIVSPEGKLLAADMNFEVKRNQNVMITGPNGAGKSSLFRIIGELWPPHAALSSQERAKIIKPKKRDILFVPQKPYLVLGTLRDQIIYPHSKADMERQGVTDADLQSLLKIVDPKEHIRKTWNWDDEKDWFQAFSGGQKQRVAMARLFYHKPNYAILDECTSAVSDEVEDEIYRTCTKLGITLFTVSHRKYLRKHHDFILTIEGRDAKWHWSKIHHGDENL